MAKKVREKRKAEGDTTKVASKKPGRDAATPTSGPKKAAPPPPEPDDTEPNDGDGAEERALVVKEKEDLAKEAPEEGEAAEPTDDALAAREGEELVVEEAAATQLGSQRYVMAGFFAAGLLAAYIFGKMLHAFWAYAANQDWFSQNFPVLTAVTDDDKTTYATILGGILAVVFVVRTYRKAEVRAWSDDVASELAKVKWPTKKDVTNSTIVVIAASAVATIYLALLDRLWAAVTNLVYGTGI
jgi:preprotein translocase subunit SecE